MSIIKKLAGGYDDQVVELGLSTATRKFLGTTGGKVSPNFEEGAEKCLKKNSVLVIGTHPGRVQASAILAAMPDREDSFVIGNAVFENIGPNFSEKLIPISLGKKGNKGQVKKLIGGVKGLVKRAIGFESENLDRDTARRKNQEGLARAAEIINGGGRVLMFPDNVHERSKDGAWLGGIGRLLRQMNPNAKVVFASGDPSFTPGAALRGEHVVSTKVTFSEPMTVGEFLANAGEEADVDSVVNSVEKKYLSWRASIKEFT